LGWALLHPVGVSSSRIHLKQYSSCSCKIFWTILTFFYLFHPTKKTKTMVDQSTDGTWTIDTIILKIKFNRLEVVYCSLVICGDGWNLNHQWHPEQVLQTPDSNLRRTWYLMLPKVITLWNDSLH
jgi:hypothetical protein